MDARVIRSLRIRGVLIGDHTYLTQTQQRGDDGSTIGQIAVGARVVVDLST